MRLASSYNYIGLFLTMRCNYNCSYCINWKISCFGEALPEYWIESLNNLETDLDITLQGGEPTLYKGFYEVVNNIPHKIDLLTNLSFDIKEFVSKVSVDKFNNNKTFAPIRASFHSKSMVLVETLEKINFLINNGYRVGLYCIDCNDNSKAIEKLKKISWLDLQIKPLLDNRIRSSEAPEHRYKGSFECRSRELLISPEGKVFRCHRDFYMNGNSVGKISKVEDNWCEYKICNYSNQCHPCDLKLKRDRFGHSGYRAITIRSNDNNH